MNAIDWALRNLPFPLAVFYLFKADLNPAMIAIVFPMWLFAPTVEGESAHKKDGLVLFLFFVPLIAVLLSQDFFSILGLGVGISSGIALTFKDDLGQYLGPFNWCLVSLLFLGFFTCLAGYFGNQYEFFIYSKGLSNDFIGFLGVWLFALIRAFQGQKRGHIPALLALLAVSLRLNPVELLSPHWMLVSLLLVSSVYVKRQTKNNRSLKRA